MERKPPAYAHILGPIEFYEAASDIYCGWARPKNPTKPEGTKGIEEKVNPELGTKNSEN